MGDTRAHSIFAPSSAYRWLECIQSVRDLENLPPEETNPEAIEGTDAHWLSEQVFTAILVPNHYRKTVNALEYVGADLPSGAKCTKTMAKFVQSYVDYVLKNFEINRGTLFIEQKLEMPKIDERLFGSADVVHLTWSNTIHVFDLKYGLWPVEVHDNPQLKLYALGALTKFKDRVDLSKPVTAHICQPRVEHKDGKFRSTKFSVDELIKFGNMAKDKIKTYDEPNPPFKEGEHCQFCPREFFCPERNRIGRKVFL